MIRHITIFVVAALIIFGVGFGLMTWFRQNDVDRPGRDRGETARETGVSRDTAQDVVDYFAVNALDGKVERRGSGESDWRPVIVGTRLRIDDSIKTEQGASVRLAVGENSEIELVERTEVTVREIAQAMHRLNLVKGRLQIDYNERQGRLLVVSVSESGAVAKTIGAKFTMMNAEGTVSVATEKGNVKLTSANETVEVDAGTMSYARPAEAPRPLQPLPVSVMLKVARPAKQTAEQPYIAIRGKTSVGARVTANSQPAKVDGEGQFKVVVPLRVGRNQIDVVAEDVRGNMRSESLPKISYERKQKVGDKADIRWGKPNEAKGHQPR